MICALYVLAMVSDVDLDRGRGDQQRPGVAMETLRIPAMIR